MNKTMKCVPGDPKKLPGACACRSGLSTRREFLSAGTCCLTVALASYGTHIDAAHMLFVTGAQAAGGAGAEVSYPLPAEDGISIDQENEVILVRSERRIFAFAVSCPHENTALRWRRKDFRFQCPRHAATYAVDGSYQSGRVTRNMDRFAIRLDGQKVVVNLAALYRSDQQKAEWESAVIAL